MVETELAGDVEGGVNVVLRDGSTVLIRPARREDHDALRDFLAGLSEESRWFRFFGTGVDLDRAAQAALMGGHTFSLVAVTGADAHIIGHGMFVRETPGQAEVAFAVADDWRAHGIATILLAHLAERALDARVDTFTATVLPGNHRMIDVFRTSGYPLEVRSAPDEIIVSFPTSLSPEGRRRFEERERVAAVAAVASVLRPGAMAVVGASGRRGTLGGEVVHNLVEGGYTGLLYAVSPRAERIEGVPSYGSVADLPGPIAMAVIAVDADEVIDAARACGEKGARALVILSAGFAEVGEPGLARQRELMDVCRAAGMRVVGPNCLGVLNTDPEVSLNATYAPSRPSPGSVALVSQSGAVGIAALDLAAERSIGLSSFVSIGDRADLSGSDLLQYWEADSATSAILLYLEVFGNPRRFGRVARRVASDKPVLAVKSGRSRAGRRSVTSHTGAIVAASETSVDALFEAAGVLRMETIGEMFDVAGLLSRRSLPRGNNVAIVTNTAGLGILCADACDANRLRVEPLGGATQRALAAALPPEASVRNPVDMAATATADDYERTLRTVLDDPAVDAVITIFVRPFATRARDVAAAVGTVAASPAANATPLLAVFMGADKPGPPPPSVPTFSTPEEAARALGLAVRHARRRAQPPDPVPDLEGIDLDRSASIVASALGAGGGWLRPAQVDALLRCWSVPVVNARFATSARAAARAAAALGGPVAVKGIAPGLVHKSEAGAVRLGLKGTASVERAARGIAAAATAADHQLSGFLVQTMAPEGVEMLFGILGDPDFGPLVAVGAGGTAAELIRDVQVRLAPLGRREAAAALRGLRMFPLLTGYRGQPEADVAAVEDVLLRISALAAAHPEIAELDCNPVIAGPRGALVVDARLRLAPPPPRPAVGSLDR